jgi:hypothetical protein
VLLEGWAANEADPFSPVILDATLDGRPLALLVANQYRVDLDHAGIGEGIGGFRLRLPAAALTGGRLALHRASDGAALPIPARTGAPARLRLTD